MLYHLQRTMIEFQDRPLPLQTKFLRKLVQASEQCSARGPDGAWLLKPGALVSLICHVRHLVFDQGSNDRAALKEGIRISTSTIEGLKVFAYLKEDSWEMLINKLRGWITGDASELTDAEVQELRLAVLEDWFAVT